VNRNLLWLVLAQGLFLTNNVTFIAINGLVGFSLAPYPWMATLPVMGYVVGGALSSILVARTQARLGRKRSFQLGLLVAIGSAGLAAWAVLHQQFWWLFAATLVAGFYSANAQLYRFVGPELCAPEFRDRAISWVMAGGLLGAVIGPNLARHTRDLLEVPFAAAYLALMVVGLVGLGVISRINFPPAPEPQASDAPARAFREIVRQPVFIVAALAASLGYGVMNLLMAATPLAMQVCRLPFEQTALVLEWHVIGMFAPGFFTGHLMQRLGVLPVMGVGVGLCLLCIGIALSGTTINEFLLALFLLGVGWNFLFTGSTTLAMQTYRPRERDQAQGAINFCVFSTMTMTSLGSGALVTMQGWERLNLGSLLPVLIVALALAWLGWRQTSGTQSAQPEGPGLT